MFASLIIRTFYLVFFSRNIVFLSQQISRNSVSACFFSEANRASIASREDRPAQVKRKRIPIKKLGLPKKKVVDISKVPLNSPSMGTRSKAVLPSSLAMSPRSKRRLSLWFVICLLNLLVVCETNICLNLHSCVTLFVCDWNYDGFMWDLVNCNACVKNFRAHNILLCILFA